MSELFIVLTFASTGERSHPQSLPAGRIGTSDLRRSRGGSEHYKVPPNVLEPHATTLDYVVAATAG